MKFTLYLYQHREIPYWKYIGGTFMSPARRHQGHLSGTSPTRFDKALRKDPSAFAFAVLKEYDLDRMNPRDVDKADRLERYSIRKFKSHKSHGGLNERYRSCGGFRRYCSRDADKEKKIIEMYENNESMTIKDVSRKFANYNSDKISRILKENGVETRPNKRFDESVEKKIVNEYCMNFIDSEKLAEKYNCSRGCIVYILKKHGMSLRKRNMISTEDSYRIAEMHIDGMPMNELSEKFQLHQDMIRKALKWRERDIDAYRENMKSYNIVKECKNEMIRLFVAENVSTVRIAEKFNAKRRLVIELMRLNARLINDVRFNGMDINEILPRTELIEIPDIRQPRYECGRLTKEMEREILKLHESGKYSANELVVKFNLLYRSQVRKIIKKAKEGHCPSL